MTEKTTPIVAYKGFDKNLICRDFQYEIGKSYSMDGDIQACSRGFHACEHPLNVFGYYAPASSRFAEVRMSGKISRDTSDSKIASAEIAIVAELKLPDIIARAISYVFDRAKPEGEGSHATGDQGAASATGYQGAASATGRYGAASATGRYGAASATGDQGAAMSSGYAGKVSGAAGNALFLTERLWDWSDDHGKILHVWAGIVGQDGIKPDTFYTLKDGKPVEVA